MLTPEEANKLKEEVTYLHDLSEQGLATKEQEKEFLNKYLKLFNYTIEYANSLCSLT